MVRTGSYLLVGALCLATGLAIGVFIADTIRSTSRSSQNRTSSDGDIEDYEIKEIAIMLAGTGYTRTALKSARELADKATALKQAGV